MSDAEEEVAERERQALEAVNEAHTHLQVATTALRRMVGGQTAAPLKRAARSLLNRLDALAVEKPGTLTERLMHARVQALKARASIAEAALASHAAAMRELAEVALMKLQLEAELGVLPASAPQQAAEPDEELWDEETRRGARVAMQCAIDYASEFGFFTGFTTNVSVGGVFIATTQLLAVGTRLGLAFTLPTGQIIQAEGEVRWVREYQVGAPAQYPGLGVRFTAMSLSDSSVLNAFIASREETSLVS